VGGTVAGGTVVSGTVVGGTVVGGTVVGGTVVGNTVGTGTVVVGAVVTGAVTGWVCRWGWEGVTTSSMQPASKQAAATRAKSIPNIRIFLPSPLIFTVSFCSTKVANWVLQYTPQNCYNNRKNKPSELVVT
jgi:uncharacterized protein YcfJ